VPYAVINNTVELKTRTTAAVIEAIRTEYTTSSSAIAETALQGGLLLWPKLEDCNWEKIFYGHYRSVFNHCDVIGQQNNRIIEFGGKTQNMGYYAVQGHSRSSRSVSIESPYATSC